MASELVQRMAEVLSVRSAYREVFKTPSGEKVLRHLCRSAKVNTSAFVAGSPDQTAYLNGQRDIVISILRYVHGNDDEIKRAIEQAYKQEKQNE